MKYLKSTCFLVTSICLCQFSPEIAAQSKGAESSEWIFLANNADNTTTYSAKAGSFEVTSTKGGAPIALILGQIHDKKTNKISYSKFYVSVRDCERGTGKIVGLTIEGEFSFESDYVSKGENIASYLGDFICSVHRLSEEANEAKGI